MSDTKPTLTLMIAAPRGFCAGVDRAIEIVNRFSEINSPSTTWVIY